MTAAGARKLVRHEACRKTKATHTSSIGGNGRTRQITSRRRWKKIVGCMLVACLAYRTKPSSTRKCVRCSKITKCKCPKMHHLLSFGLMNASSEAVSKLISPHPSSNQKPGSHYYLFVDFPSAAAATAAAQALDGSPTRWGGTLRVNTARNNANRKVEREQYGNRKASENTTQDGPKRDLLSDWRSKGS